MTKVCCQCHMCFLIIVDSVKLHTAETQLGQICSKHFHPNFYRKSLSTEHFGQKRLPHRLLVYYTVETTFTGLINAGNFLLSQMFCNNHTLCRSPPLDQQCMDWIESPPNYCNDYKEDETAYTVCTKNRRDQGCRGTATKQQS